MNHDLSTIEMSLEAHAARARRNAKLNGAADCIHFAPDWSRRCDQLHAAANASDVPWWRGRLPSGLKSGQPYLIEDGRMVLACETVWFVELRGAA